MANKKNDTLKVDTLNFLKTIELDTLTRLSGNDNLATRVKYTLEHAETASMSDLKALLQEIKTLGQKTEEKKTEEVVPSPVEEKTETKEEAPAPTEKKKVGGVTKSKKPTEGSLKKKTPVTTGITEVKTEEKKEEVKAPAKEKPKAPVTKSKDKSKTEEKKSEIETLPPASNVGIDKLPQAMMFPAVIEHEDLGKLVAQTGKYTTYKEIFEALEADKTLYFACYWTKRHIKEYQYSMSYNVEAPKNGFPHDLDIAMAVVPCETRERLYAMSRYTEAMYRFEGEDFSYVEDTDPRSGNKFRIRVSAGMEFEIYAPAEEVEAKK